MKKYAILVVLTMVLTATMSAQQDAQYTQYMYNTLSINPAYAGSRGLLSMTGLHRSQWVGLDGAPITQTLNIHSPVGKRVGVGLSIVNDEIGNGTSKETYFDGSFSYTLQLAKTRRLSFGIKAGGHLLNIDYSQLPGYIDEQGSNGLVNIDRKFSPNFGAGIYYHSNSFYLGLSTPNILETEHFDGSATTSSYLAKERINYYFMTGYVFDINNNLKFKPAFLLKMVNGAPLQTDFSANFLIYDRFSIGGAYRWEGAVSALVGFQISKQFLLGVAYDKETTSLGNVSFNDGSFEIFLRFELFNQLGNLLTPRFF